MSDEPTRAVDDAAAESQRCSLSCPRFAWITTASVAGPAGARCDLLDRRLADYSMLNETDVRPFPVVPADCPGPPRCAWCGGIVLRADEHLYCTEVGACPGYRNATPWEAVADIAERAADEVERLGALLDAIMKRLEPNRAPAIIVRPGAYDDAHCDTLNALFNDRQAPAGTLRERLLSAGFKLIMLPPGVYGIVDSAAR